MLCLLPEVTPLGAVHPTWTSRSDGFLVKDDTDILIAGAGPAGCVAGMLLARQGFRVVILEKRTPPFRKICGDLIGPRSLWYLKELPVAWDSKGWEGNPVRSLQVYDEKRMRSWAPLPGKSTGPGTAEAVSRILLDGYLREQAEAAGCTIRYGSNFRAVVERRGHRVICSVTEKKKERLWMTPVLLGADGARSAVARHVPQDLSRARPSGHVVAARGYFGNVKGLRDSVELYFLSRYLPGYAWVIPLGNGVANVGLGLRADACRRKGLRPVQEVYRFLQSHPVLAGRMRGAVPQEEVRGWVVGAGGSGLHSSAANVILLGDAAGLANPLSGEGIFSAMRSAAMAVPFVREAFSRGDFSGALFAGYENAVHRYFQEAYRRAAWLSSLPSDHSLLKPVVRWGLKQVQKNSTMDGSYARRVGAFFSGMDSGERLMTAKWLGRTLWR